ncbi:hypothetical protein [Hathewaya limosa]|uniref:DUF5673 domain-containing protein n=1 Tax=Hathewaya limosa TaxID=1536 RepID=A0ABU0JPN1_HATLI|nr:hypothetical protein [Hathewaya limosa]MDQ0479046.1 hypothetical protein [Hathewaya limosa]
MGDNRELIFKYKNSRIIFNAITVICLVTMVFLRKLPTRNNLTAILYVIFFSSGMIFAIAQIYAFITKKYKKPNLTIKKDKIIFLDDFFMNSNKIKLNEISKIYIPEYDNIIEIKLKNHRRRTISLSHYKKEDRELIKEIFKDMQEEIV